MGLRTQCKLRGVQSFAKFEYCTPQKTPNFETNQDKLFSISSDNLELDDLKWLEEGTTGLIKKLRSAFILYRVYCLRGYLVFH